MRIDASKAFKAYLGTLKNAAIEIIVRKKRQHRTKPQVAYYFGVVIPALASELGYRRDEHYQLHDGLMFKFWPLEPDRLTGSPRRRRLTLQDGAGPEPPLSDEEMREHIDLVVQFAAEHGAVVPDAEREAA